MKVGTRCIIKISCIILASASYADCSVIPERTINVIVPNTTGSAYDLYVRTMEPQFEIELQREVVVRNLAGGGGIVGARRIAEAKADGTTLGIVNGAGLLTAQLAGRENVPHLLEDMHVLGRASSMQHVWAVKNGDAFLTFQDLYATPRSLVFAARNVASTSFVSLSVGAYVLDLPHEFVVGYDSNRSTRLAALRGEVDVVSMDLASGLKRIQRGELRPLLQISAKTYDHVGLSMEVPTLLQEVKRQIDPHRHRVAETLLRLLGSNRLFVAPKGTSAEVSKCLEHAIAKTLATPAVVQLLQTRAAPINYADRQQALTDLHSVYESISELKPIIASAVASMN